MIRNSFVKFSCSLFVFLHLCVKLFLFFGFIILTGCFIYTPNSPAYKALYAHLEKPMEYRPATWTSHYFVVIYVNARHLDYTDNLSFFKTVIRHPSDGSLNRDVGHVWIHLQGILNDKPVYICGGHSGERGIHQAKYFDGIMNYMDYGYANPSGKEVPFPRYEPNPVKYLWEIQKDGYFQWGSGYHKPTFAAKFDLTPEQFERILDFVQKYDYTNYALTGNQCTSFAAQLASLAGLDLECEITISIDKNIYYKGERIRFWQDPSYALLTISTPDIIERSLMEAVREGKAECINCR